MKHLLKVVAVASRARAVVAQLTTAVEALLADVLRSVTLLARVIRASHTVVRQLISGDKHVTVPWQASAPCAQIAVQAVALAAGSCVSRVAVLALLVFARDTVVCRRHTAAEGIVVAVRAALTVVRYAADRVVTEARVALANSTRARSALAVRALLAGIARFVTETENFRLFFYLLREWINKYIFI